MFISTPCNVNLVDSNIDPTILVSRFSLYSFYFNPFFQSDFFQELWCFGLLLGNMDSQFHPQIMYWIEVRRMYRLLQNPERVFTEPAFVAWIIYLKSLSCWKIKSRFIFSALSDERMFLPQTHYTWPYSSSCPQNMMFPPPCFTVGVVFFACNSTLFPLQNTESGVNTKQFLCSHLITWSFCRTLDGPGLA